MRRSSGLFGQMCSSCLHLRQWHLVAGFGASSTSGMYRGCEDRGRSGGQPTRLPVLQLPLHARLKGSLHAYLNAVPAHCKPTIHPACANMSSPSIKQTKQRAHLCCSSRSIMCPRPTGSARLTAMMPSSHGLHCDTKKLLQLNCWLRRGEGGQAG